MCKCIKDLEIRLTEKLSLNDDLPPSMKPKGGKLRHLSATNTALMTDDWKHKLNIPFTARWTLPSGKDKSTIVSVIASHCPFCGVKVEESQNNELSSGGTADNRQQTEQATRRLLK
jgi:hypothetical protein